MKKILNWEARKLYFPAVFLFYLALFISVFPDVVFFGMSFAKRDVFRYYYPVWHFAIDAIRQGIFPLWNPYSSYGTPFFADIQTCVFYPLTLILYLPNYLWAFNFYILVHLALASFFVCVWMRDCGASPLASFLSGFAYGLTGYILSAINLTISLATMAYFPLVLLTLRRALRTRGFFWKSLGGVTLFFQYLAGDPTIFFASLVVAVPFVLYRTVRETCVHRKLDLKPMFDWLQIIGVFLGLAAFHIFLFTEFLFHSNRVNPALELITMWSLQYNDLVSFFFPFFSDISLFFMNYWTRQSWLENSYAGISVLVLAALAILWKRKTPLIGYHVLLALFGVSLALGKWCGVYHFFYYVFPFFKYIRYPVRFLFLFSFAMACLAGFGLDALLEKSGQASRPHQLSPNARKFAFGILSMTILIIVSMIFSPWISGKIYEIVHQLFLNWTKNKIDWNMNLTVDLATPVLENFKRTGFFVLMMLAGIFYALFFRSKKILLCLFFVFLVFSDLVEANIMEIRIPGNMMERIGENMKVLMSDKTIFRAQASPRALQVQLDPPNGSADEVIKILLEILCPNLLLPHRISYVTGYDSIFLKDVIAISGEQLKIKQPTGLRFLDMMNIKYLVSPLEDIKGHFSVVNHAKPANLFLNEHVLPRAFLVSSAVVNKNHEEILKLIVSKDFDPLKQIYLEEELPALQKSSDSFMQIPSKEEVKILEYSLNQVSMEVATASPQWLFLSDTYYPGWKALIDGKPTKIYKANFAFRAIQVLPGKHKVQWKYDPILFRIGLSITVLTGLALAAYYLKKFGKWWHG